MIYNILLTVYFVSILLIVCILTIPVLIIIYPFVNQKQFAYVTECAGSLILKSMIFLGVWKVKITDMRKNKTFNEQYVIVSNHCSYIDTLLMWQLPLYKKFMMAKKFTYIPIFGQICKACGHVLVNRFDRTTTYGAIDKAIDTMKDESSFVMFPEGRRSENPNSILPFKTGAFRLSQKLNVPILPIAIKGSGKALPVGGLCNPADIEIIIGDPVYVSSKYDDIKSHPAIDQTRRFIYDQLKDHKK